MHMIKLISATPSRLMSHKVINLHFRCGIEVDNIKVLNRNLNFTIIALFNGKEFVPKMCCIHYVSNEECFISWALPTRKIIRHLNIYNHMNLFW